MAGRDAHLVGAPSERPEGQRLVVFGCALGVVVAGYVSEAEKNVRETVLACALATATKMVNGMQGLRTYNRVELIVDIRHALTAAPRMIAFAVVAIGVLFLLGVFKRAVPAFGAERPRKVFEA